MKPHLVDDITHYRNSQCPKCGRIPNTEGHSCLEKDPRKKHIDTLMNQIVDNHKRRLHPIYNPEKREPSCQCRFVSGYPKYGGHLKGCGLRTTDTLDSDTLRE